MKKISGIALTFFAPVFIFFLFQSYIQFLPTGIKAVNALFSCLWMESLCLCLVFITGSIKIPLSITAGFFMILGIAEFYVYRFRDSFLTPIDLFSFGTAMNVASNYDFTPSAAFIAVTALFILLIILILLFCPSLKSFPMFKELKPRVFAFLAALLIFLGLTHYLRHYESLGVKLLVIDENAFHSFRNNKREGAIIRLLYDSGYLFVNKPSGYSEKEAADILDSYGEKADTAVTEELPDIVVVMNESFSDPRLVGPLETNEDYMPFIHSLQEGHEDTVTGVINVSVQGGNTPNSEFEFLTGNSMAFLPKGSIPFQQYISRDIQSIPRYLSSMGYETLAMHPYYSNGWNRTRAYPFLGFSDMKFLEYFEDMDPEYVRKYISDSFFSDVIMDEVEKRNDDGPVFSFNVTMQNHSAYIKDYDNLKKDIKIIAEEGTPYVDVLEKYLDLVKLSDGAFRKMVEHYSEVDRKTLLVFFGDHQPPTDNFEPVFHNLGTDRRNLSEETGWDIYKVPFVIWANYDIEEEKDLEISLNYLGNLVLKKAGIPLYDYRVFTDEFSKKVPVLSAVRTVDDKGNSRNLSETDVDLSEYERLQYYELFDRKTE